MRDRNRLEAGIKNIDAMMQELDDNIEFIGLGEMESDQDTIDEAEAAIVALKERTAKAEIETLLSGEADVNDCYLEVNAGAGGTEAQDWTEMLLRMYTRWADAHGYKVEWLEESDGEEAGIKSATIKISGKYFEDKEISKIALVAPNATLIEIKDYEVTKKENIHLPESVSTIVKCINPKCVTNNQNVPTSFTVTKDHKGNMKLFCKYCEKAMSQANLEFL